MIKKLNMSGQTALILILLTAAALIFFAITLNWGRISQTKSLLTIAADQSAALLGSDVASYGEMEKQGNLKDENQHSGSTGLWLIILAVVVAIVVCVLSWGTAAPLMTLFMTQVILALSVAMAVANLVLQLVVVQPSITRMWNQLQKSQPIQQQFFEQGISTALQAATTDQVNITDYLDWNANGSYGNDANGFPKDTVGRFALFYSDRLKMLNQPDIPQVVYFYDQLNELMNGESCAQNARDVSLGLGAPANPACANLNCAANPTDPACQATIPPPNDYRLNDACPANSDTTSPAYNPYCDPCCQPDNVPDPMYSATNPNPMHPNQFISLKPSYCNSIVSADQCKKNNPFNSNPNNVPSSYDSPYTLIYDPMYQNYNNKVNPSFLAEYGRDQQAAVNPSPPVEPPFSWIIPQGDFPNGIYPFFWLVKDYSLDVKDIVSTALQPPQYHWCTAPQPAPDLTLLESNKNGNPPFTYPPPGYPYLAQLTLPYACSGADCCVYNIGGTLAGSGSASYLVGGPADSAAPAGTTNAVIDIVGTTNSTAPALDPGKDTIYGSAGNPWLEGDNQFCAVEGQCSDGATCSPIGSTCPSDSSTCAYEAYNGANENYQDGTCEWTNSINPPPPPPAPPLSITANISTIDNIDETMHTLSDFAKFANGFLSEDVDSLSSTFSTWYPQLEPWIAPVGSDPDYPNGGRLVNAANALNNWSDPMTGTIAVWMKNIYTDANAWCVPPLVSPGPFYVQNDLSNDCPGPPGTLCPTQEKAAIGPDLNWGQLPWVINCLNYNANNSVTAYNSCVNDLATDNTTGSPTCFTFPPSCGGVTLGRSLAGAPINAFKPSYGPPPATSALPASGTYTSCASLPVGNTVDPTTCSDLPTDYLSDSATCAATGDKTNPCPVPGAGTTSAGTITTNEKMQSCTYSYTAYQDCNCGYSPSGGLGCSCSSSGAASGGKTCSCSYGCESCPYTAYATCEDSDPSSNTPSFQSYSCDYKKPGSYANWAKNSLTLATDEAPKFNARYQYLNKISAMAQNMQQLFATEGTTLSNFLNGPVAQLSSADKTPPAATLPNSVIYGWTDNNSLNGKPGKSHIVKVTVYSPGRAGQYTVNSSGPGLPGIFWPSLPYIKSTSALTWSWLGFFTSGIPIDQTRYYTLLDRNGPVYVGVKRWDEDHSNTVTFPNNHALWQFMFHNPNATVNTTVEGLPPDCQNLPPPPGSVSLKQNVGFGLESKTLIGMDIKNISIPDQTALGKAFMLNDNGDGQVDPSTGSKSVCSGPINQQANPYCKCLYEANQLLATAPESHACVEYVASVNATKYIISGNDHGDDPGDFTEKDYSLKFVPMSGCGNTIGNAPLQDDLNYGD